MRRERTLIYFVFCLIGICLILAAAILNRVDQNGISAEVVKDVGVVIGAVALIDLLWSRFGGDPLSRQIEQLKQLNTLMSDGETSGLTHVYTRAADVKSTNWLLSIQSAKQKIDLVGQTLYQVSERGELCAALVQQAKIGVRVRILINHPDNQALPFAVDAESGNLNAMREQMARTWNYFNNLRHQLPEQSRSNLQVARLKSGVMHMALRRFDGTAYVLHYLYSQRSADTPVYVVVDEEKPLFSTYVAEFDRLFGLAEINQDVETTSSSQGIS